MKTVFDNDMCAHVWAQRNQPHGRSKSMSFQGDTIYSYRTPIGRLIDTKRGTLAALVTSERYIVTTSGKHMPAVHRAIRHLPSFTVPNLGCGDQGRHQNAAHAMHANNLAHYIKEYEAALRSLARARDNAEWKVSRLQQIRDEAQRYVYEFEISVDADYFKVNFPEPSPEQLAEVKAKAQAAAKAKAKKTAEKNKIASEAVTKAVNDYLAGEQAVFPWAWERRATLAQREAVAAKVLKLWREGRERRDFVMGLGTLPVALRVRGNNIETSHGAEFPITDAKLAFGLIAQVKCGEPFIMDNTRMRLGRFHIDRIDPDGTVKAACHTVAWPEIERVAKQLGLVA